VATCASTTGACTNAPAASGSVRGFSKSMPVLRRATSAPPPGILYSPASTTSQEKVSLPCGPSWYAHSSMRYWKLVGPTLRTRIVAGAVSLYESGPITTTGSRNAEGRVTVCQVARFGWLTVTVPKALRSVETTQGNDTTPASAPSCAVTVTL
jgi:hypothetical protein